MNRIKVSLFIALLLLTPGSVWAQLNEGGLPLEASTTALKSTGTTSEIPVITMPAFDASADTTNPRLRCGGLKFAHKFTVDIDVKANAQKTESGDWNIWKLAIKSDSASSLNLIFSQFRLPAGARLYLYTPNQEHLLGAYTHRNNNGGPLAITPLKGDKIIIDYEEPQNTAETCQLKIGQVNHGLKYAIPAFQKSEDCEVDARYDTLHTNQRRSAVHLIINGDTYCSGNLINNSDRDGTPYIISSAHCFFDDNNKIDTSKAQTTVALFNYEAPTATWQVTGTWEQSLSGGHTAAYRANRDMLLLRMNDVPPVDFMAYYAGWNCSNSIEAPVYDFHHPSGDLKKISEDEDTPSQRTFSPDGLFLSNGHWQLYRWNRGITEGGSSGSGLFDTNNQLRGQLSGGDTNESCDQTGSDDFWRYDVVWSGATNTRNNLKPFLNAAAIESDTLNGTDGYPNPCQLLSNWRERYTPEADSTNYAAGTNSYEFTEVAERFDQPQAGTLYGVYFIPQVAEKNTCTLKIYSGGKNGPEKLLSEQRVKVIYRALQDDSFRDLSETSWTDKVNYVKLSSPVKTDSTFYISLNYAGNKSTFALYHTQGRSADSSNTAYFMDTKGSWQPFTQNPVKAAASSLMIDAVYRTGQNNVDTLHPLNRTLSIVSDTTTYPEKFSLYPNPVYNTLYLLSTKGDVLHSYLICDALGHVYRRVDGLDATNEYEVDLTPLHLQPGIYLLKANYQYSEHVYKFIKISGQ